MWIGKGYEKCFQEKHFLVLTFEQDHHLNILQVLFVYKYDFCLLDCKHFEPSYSGTFWHITVFEVLGTSPSLYHSLKFFEDYISFFFFKVIENL